VKSIAEMVTLNGQMWPETKNPAVQWRGSQRSVWMMGVDLSGAPLARQQAVMMMVVTQPAKQRHREISLELAY
jgi:hypothetical protein